MYNFYKTIGLMYKKILVQQKFMYLIQNLVQIHQFWLTKLSFINKIGEN